MLFNSSAYYLSCKKTVGIKDPSKIYYAFNFLVDEEPLTVMGNEDLFALAHLDFTPMTAVTLVLDYNPQYKNIRLHDLIKDEKKVTQK